LQHLRVVAFNTADGRMCKAVDPRILLPPMLRPAYLSKKLTWHYHFWPLRFRMPMLRQYCLASHGFALIARRRGRHLCFFENRS
jgi:hypothetical protein